MIHVLWGIACVVIAYIAYHEGQRSYWLAQRKAIQDRLPDEFDDSVEDEPEEFHGHAAVIVQERRSQLGALRQSYGSAAFEEALVFLRVFPEFYGRWTALGVTPEEVALQKVFDDPDGHQFATTYGILPAIVLTTLRVADRPGFFATHAIASMSTTDLMIVRIALHITKRWEAFRSAARPATTADLQ